jgi:tetratricopeptide (TPR) repeat protein
MKLSSQRFQHLAAVSLIVCFSAPAQAAEPGPGSAAPTTVAPANTAGGDARDASTSREVEEARVHFQRGIEFFGEESYEAALVEFERAYEIAPSYQILYNTGRIHAALKDYARALRDLTRYLREGGDAIQDERRQQVLQLTRTLEQKVATLEIVSNVPGARISVDDVPLGEAPLKGQRVNPGSRRITASKPGYNPSTLVVTVVASEARRVSIDPQRVAQSKVITERASIAPVVAWAATGVLAAGAAATGIVALNAEKKLDDRKNSEVGAPAGSFDDDADKVRNWSIASDALTAGALIAGGVSIYLTFFQGSRAEPAPQKAGVSDLVVAPGSVAIRGLF